MRKDTRCECISVKERKYSSFLWGTVQLSQGNYQECYPFSKACEFGWGNHESAVMNKEIHMWDRVCVCNQWLINDRIISHCSRVDERHMEIHVFLMQNASLPTFPLLSHIKLAKQDEPEPGGLFDSTGKSFASQMGKDSRLSRVLSRSGRDSSSLHWCGVFVWGR